MIGPSGIVREALLRGMLAFLAPPATASEHPSELSWGMRAAAGAVDLVR